MSFHWVWEKNEEKERRKGKGERRKVERGEGREK